MAEDVVVKLDSLSLTSLYLKLQVNGLLLENATGFVVASGGKHYLVTNWHVLSGRDPNDGLCRHPSGALPDEVRVAHHVKGRLGVWKFHGERLHRDDGSPRWITHPLGLQVDVALLELQNVQPDTDFRPLDLDLAKVDVLVSPGTPVAVIGFLFGLRPNVFLPIWKTGHLASDMDYPYKGLPAFLIDATTRSGMSGSPVMVRTSGGFMRKDGTFVMATGGLITRFLGVYSGRIDERAEIGIVWRPSVVKDLLAVAAGETVYVERLEIPDDPEPSS